MKAQQNGLSLMEWDRACDYCARGTAFIIIKNNPGKYLRIVGDAEKEEFHVGEGKENRKLY